MRVMLLGRAAVTSGSAGGAMSAASNAGPQHLVVPCNLRIVGTSAL